MHGEVGVRKVGVEGLGGQGRGILRPWGVRVNKVGDGGSLDNGPLTRPSAKILLHTDSVLLWHYYKMVEI